MISLPGFRKQPGPSGQQPSALDVTGLAGKKTPAYDAAALEALVQRAEQAAEALRSLESLASRGDEIAAMQSRVEELEGRLAAAGQAAAELDALRSRSAEQAASQQQVGSDIAALGAEAGRITEALAGMGEKIEGVLQLRDQLDHVEELNAQFVSMNKEAGAVRSQVRDLTENLSRLRTVHDDVLRAHKHATIRLDGLDERHQTAVNRMDALERRAKSSDEALEALLRISSGIPDVQHQLGVLKATADQVFQKTAALESQREMVERALGQSSDVASLSARLAAAFRGQEEQSQALNAFERRLAEVQAQHGTVLSRSAEIVALQQKLEEAGRDATRELSSLREEIRASTERFELENRSLDATGERIAELRGVVTETEARVASLDATVQVVGETESRARSLASQVEHLGEDVARISSQAERLRVVRDDVGDLDERLRDLGGRMERVEGLRPSVDEVARELAALNGAQESVHDGLEQVRMAATELSRLREVHAETTAWLTDSDERLRVLRGRVEELERARPAVDALTRDVARVNAQIATIDSRRSSLDDVHNRMAAMEATVAQLDERSASVRSRMDAAEARFVDLARQAGEAQRVTTTIAGVTAAVDGVEARMGPISASIDSLEEHAQRLDGFADRVRLLGQELDQRQAALEKAAGHLAKASEERREAADTARRLEELTRTMAAQLGEAESRSAGVSGIAHELEARAAALGDVDRRMSHLEALLGRCETAQASAAQALEQIVGRQATVDAVEAQVKRVFQVAERTTQDVHDIAAARRDVEGARALLDDMQERLKATTGAMDDLMERKRQVERLEEKLARAEALAHDVHSTVEVISAQGSVIEQVLQRSGTLAVQSKQAEGLIEALRAECVLAASLQETIRGQRKRKGADGD